MTCFHQLLPELKETNSVNEQLALLNPLWCWQQSNDENTVTISALLNTSLIAEQVKKARLTLQAPNDKVAASLIQKKLMTQLISPLVAVHVLSEQSPHFSLSGLVIPSDFSKPVMWLNEGFCAVPSNDFIVWIERLIQSFYLLFRHTFAIPPKTFWGNAALAIASPWSRLVGQGVNGKIVAQDVQQFFSHLCPELQQALEWLVIEKGEFEIMVPRRNNCCLKYRLPEKQLCGTCNRQTKQQQIDRVITRLV
ncbi:(2Fe-2S)-binding protein [Photobacterium profundum]|uniref:(2Fe-2S)-binding protein n=1 Tax=Photobacterium profundum TaxID=74109 RepID=UPI003D116730